MLKITKPTILKNKNFMLLWIGQSISKLGDQFHGIAAMWYVYMLTGSSLKMGITLVCSTVPSLIFSPLAGILADKCSRKKIIILSNLISGALVLMLYILIFTHNISIVLIYVLTALITISTTFFSPSIAATIPSIVEKDTLIEANSFSQLSSGICGVLGPVLAGIIIAILGVPLLFLLDSISFFIAASFEMLIYIPKPIAKDSAKTKLSTDLKEGFLYAIKNKKLLHFIIVGGVIINFFLAPLSIYIPIFSNKILKMGSFGFSAILTALTIGGIVTAALTPFIKNRINYFTLTFIGLTMEGITLVLFSLSNTIYLACTFAVLFGVSVSLCNTSLGTVFQTLTPNSMMGRVSSIMNMMCTVTNPLGIFIGSLMPQIISIRFVMLISGIIVAISGFSTITIIRTDHQTSTQMLEAAE